MTRRATTRLKSQCSPPLSRHSTAWWWPLDRKLVVAERGGVSSSAQTPPPPSYPPTHPQTYDEKGKEKPNRACVFAYIYLYKANERTFTSMPYRIITRLFQTLTFTGEAAPDKTDSGNRPPALIINTFCGIETSLATSPNGAAARISLWHMTWLDRFVLHDHRNRMTMTEWCDL